MGWRCSVFGYCDPDVHCQTDATCETLTAGKGVTCVSSGPGVGECAIKCTGAADCPNSNGATPSPYACRDTTLMTASGTSVIHICRF
jgi:hypothetical protein